MYDDAYENFSIDPAQRWENPIKKTCYTKLLALLLGEKYTEIKAWQLKPA